MWDFNIGLLKIKTHRLSAVVIDIASSYHFLTIITRQKVTNRENIDNRARTISNLHISLRLGGLRWYPSNRNPFREQA